MRHQDRWTADKIARRLRLIEPLAYRRRASLPPFRYKALGGPLEPPPVGAEVDDSGWTTIEPHSYWAGWKIDFVLRTTFAVPTEWAGLPVAVHLPLGESGDFLHPEALAYVDGQPYAAIDRHHQEITLPDRWKDGRARALALHGWSGLGGFRPYAPGGRLYMREPVLALIDPATRAFLATARVALGAAQSLEDVEPARGRLLTALDEAFRLLETR
jgi:alpha-mannosidase